MVEASMFSPLPQNSGVDTLRMQIGDRFLEGQVKEREQARKIYEQAAAAGFKATLIEQQRPNIFTNSVANIGPHETVVVQSVSRSRPSRRRQVPIARAARRRPALHACR